MALNKETMEAMEVLDKYLHDVQKTAMHLCDALHNLQVSGDAGNAALAMALAVSTKQSGMSKEEALARFKHSLDSVYGAKPTWQ